MEVCCGGEISQDSQEPAEVGKPTQQGQRAIRLNLHSKRAGRGGQGDSKFVYWASSHLA